jgi:hypothetical protein
VDEVTYPEFYGELFAALASPLTPADQVPEDVITANERRLRVRLPEALRSYYQTAGNMRRLNEAYNRLLAPDEWKLDQAVLVFLHENQGVVKWGVPAHKAPPIDPIVRYTVSQSPGECSDWALEELVCSDFLILMLCWQAVHGGLPHTGWAQVNQAVGRAVVERLGPVYRTRDLRASYRSGQVVCVAGRGDPLDLLAAGRSKDEFGGLLRELAGIGVSLEVQ